MTDTQIHLTDDEIIRLTQGNRQKLLQTLTQDGIPKTTEEQMVLLKTLSDMDKAALSNKKIGASEKRSVADALVANALTGILDKLDGKNPFEQQRDVTIVSELQKDELLPAIEVQDGETAIGAENENYKSFMKKFDEK